MEDKIQKNTELSDENWVEQAVEEYRQRLIDFKKEISIASDGTLLDVADRQIIENFEPMLKNIQQEMIQQHINQRQNNNDYRRCPKCKKK